MHVAEIGGCASVLADWGEGDDDLLAWTKAKLFEECNVFGVQVTAVLLEELLLFGKEGDVAKLYASAG